MTDATDLHETGPFGAFFKMSALTGECLEVIGLRTVKAMWGGSAATEEAMLMMSEKAEAAMRCGSALMAGDSIEAVIDDYRTVVRANAVRLHGA
ncbi:hypothetical protein [Chenggangzhangella methanolivorans]|nr:hypothetical protein [Chenggangzhangella methanolivorans]